MEFSTAFSWVNSPQALLHFPPALLCRERELTPTGSGRCLDRGMMGRGNGKCYPTTPSCRGPFSPSLPSLPLHRTAHLRKCSLFLFFAPSFARLSSASSSYIWQNWAPTLPGCLCVELSNCGKGGEGPEVFNTERSKDCLPINLENKQEGGENSVQEGDPKRGQRGDEIEENEKMEFRGNKQECGSLEASESCLLHVSRQISSWNLKRAAGSTSRRLCGRPKQNRTLLEALLGNVTGGTGGIFPTRSVCAL